MKIDSRGRCCRQYATYRRAALARRGLAFRASRRMALRAPLQAAGEANGPFSRVMPSGQVPSRGEPPCGRPQEHPPTRIEKSPARAGEDDLQHAGGVASRLRLVQVHAAVSVGAPRLAGGLPRRDSGAARPEVPFACCSRVPHLLLQ